MLLWWKYTYRFFFFFQAEDGIRDVAVTGVQTCALPILRIADIVFEWRFHRLTVSCSLAVCGSSEASLCQNRRNESARYSTSAAVIRKASRTISVACLYAASIPKLKPETQGTALPAASRSAKRKLK